MKFTINGKQYTEFDINKRCAELVACSAVMSKPSNGLCMVRKIDGHVGLIPYNPCKNPADTWTIIEKCWDELIEPVFIDKNNFEWYQSRWSLIMEAHNCTKLIAACICFIELSEVA
jgi:hypothetical protein